MSFGLSFNLMQNEWKILRQITKGDVPEGIACSRLDLLTMVVEGYKNCRFQILQLAQICSTTNFSNGQKAEREAIVLLVRGQIGQKLLNNRKSLSLTVTHKTGNTFCNVGASSL